MAKITHIKTEEIVVHQILEYDVKSFFEEVVKQSLVQQMNVIPSVNWFDGVAFVLWRFPETEDVVREELEGTYHYSTILFTRMEHQPTYQTTLVNQEVKVPLRKVGNNPDFIDLVEFLKDFKPDPRAKIDLR